jgi:hypothetical protein
MPAIPKPPAPSLVTNLPRREIEPVALQGVGDQRRRMRPGDTAYAAEGAFEFPIQLEVPGSERLFRIETEADLQERMRQEALDRNMERIAFPDEQPLTKEKYKGRTFARSVELVEPHYVMYDRLLLEDINAERYGWNLGVLQPLASTAKFYWDVIWLPYHLGTRPCQKYDSSAGYCLPGDPVPYLLYPPELSLTGAAAEGGTIAALLAIFP